MITFDYETHEGDIEEVIIKCKKELCPRCEGDGKHVNPAIDENGLTYDDVERLGGDEFFSDYLRGVYDVRCERCKGLRVIDVPDPDRNPSELLAAYEEHLQDEADYRAECEMERRMGA